MRPRWRNHSMEGALLLCRNRYLYQKHFDVNFSKSFTKCIKESTDVYKMQGKAYIGMEEPKDFELTCNRCKNYQKPKSSLRKEPSVLGELPERPFDVVSTDLFDVGKNVCMIFAARLSGYPLDNVRTKDRTTNRVVKQLR